MHVGVVREALLITKNTKKSKPQRDTEERRLRVASSSACEGAPSAAAALGTPKQAGSSVERCSKRKAHESFGFLRFVHRIDGLAPLRGADEATRHSRIFVALCFCGSLTPCPPWRFLRALRGSAF